jgi:stage IV sporulation protein FB
MRKIKKISFGFFGVAVEVKISFIVLAAVSALLGYLKLICVTFVFVTLHELCHILISTAFGARVKKVTIYPVGESANMAGFEDINIFKRLVVILSAPMLNIVLGILLHRYEVGKINIVLGIFNLLPVYPLDGGRAVHYIIGYFTGALRSNRYIAVIGRVTSIFIILFGMVQMILYSYNISLLVVGVYLLKMNGLKYINVTYALYRSLTQKRKRRVLPLRSIVVSPGTDTKTIIYRLGWDYYLNVHVKGENGKLYTISEDEFIVFIMKRGINCEISNILLEKSA